MPDSRAVAPEEFDLIEKVGAGAWGEVWRATQRPTQRTVAIKFLAGVSAPDGTRASQLAWRFQREIEAAAQQDHPHIAAIIASGVSAGQPWFAMEFVEGARLDDFAAALQLRERLALFRRVCEGVQHAHDNGVIHRDLKPANILVRADGIPKILDFGLARFLDDAGLGQTLTLDDQPLGTPLFMAPEQAAGQTRELGVGTDIYALGVILYHLATGDWPFDATLPPLQLLAAVRDTEPRPPRSLPRDLAAIIRKAMAREKADRYPSVRAFSEDLAHFLAGEPVVARAWTFGYVLRRRLHKHWRAAAVGVVIFALAAAYLEERRRAAARNVRSLHQAKELINTMVFDLHERLQPLGMTDVLAGVTERVAQFPWDLEKDASGQLDLRRFQALAADVRGDAFAGKDQKVEALAEYRTAAALLDELAREHPQNPGLLAESAAEQLAVNRMLDATGSHDDALARSHQLLAELERRASGPADGALARLRLDAHRVIGQILLGRGRFTEAEAEVRAALRLAAMPGGDAPSSALLLAELHIDLGNACQGLGRLPDAGAAHAEAARICRGAIAQNGGNQPARETLSRSLMGTATAAIAAGELAPAGHALDEAYAGRLRLHGDSAIPVITPADFTLAAAYQDLGRALVGRGQDASAIEALEPAHRVLAAIFPSTKERVATRIKLHAVLREIAGAHLRLGHELEAARAFHEALGHSKELRKHALDDPRWLLANLDGHVHLLSLPMVSRTPSYADRRKVIAESFGQLTAMKNLTDAQRQTAEELRARSAATPPR